MCQAKHDLRRQRKRGLAATGGNDGLHDSWDDHSDQDDHTGNDQQGDEVEPERRCEGLRGSLRRINKLLVDEDYRGLGLRSPQRAKRSDRIEVLSSWQRPLVAVTMG